MADNLIGNGLRFAKRQVIVCVLEEESGLTLEVKDDGTGFDISEERAKQAFTTSGFAGRSEAFWSRNVYQRAVLQEARWFSDSGESKWRRCVRAYFRSIVPESVVPETEEF